MGLKSSNTTSTVGTVDIINSLYNNPNSSKEKDKASPYSMMSYFNENIGPKYFQFNDINQSRLGVFGWSTEVMADTTTDIVNMLSIMYNEFFVNKAQIPQTIYNYAHQYNITDIYATPAQMDMTIIIKESDLIRNAVSLSTNVNTSNSNTSSILGGGTKAAFFIDNDSVITVEDQYEFMLPYDIRIDINPIMVNDSNTFLIANNEDTFLASSKIDNYTYIYTASYITTNGESFPDDFTPYLKISTVAINGENYVFIPVTCEQKTKTTQYVTITQHYSDYVSYIVQDFTYSGMLSSFKLYYKNPTDTSYTELTTYLMNDTPTDSDGLYCYYTQMDSSTIQITFSTDEDAYHPVYGTEIMMVIYTTLGSDGNFDYDTTSTASSNISLKLQSDIFTYNNIYTVVASDGNSAGGEDAKTTDQLKTLISYYASTSNNIATTLDLNKYFKNISESNQYLPDLYFVKKRDDILTRLFTGYMLLEDLNDAIIPTNTLDLVLNETQLLESDSILSIDATSNDGGRYIIKAGSKFSYNYQQLGETEVEDADDVNENVYNYSYLGVRLVDEFDSTAFSYFPSWYHYTNPFLIAVNKSPYLSVSYYLNSMNQTINTNYAYINSNKMVQFISKSFNMQRDAINEPTTTSTIVPSTVDILSAYRFNIDITPNINNVSFSDSVSKITLGAGESNGSLSGQQTATVTMPYPKVYLIYNYKNDMGANGLVSSSNSSDTVMYTEMQFISSDNSTLSYGSYLTTNDIITLDNTLTITNVNNGVTNPPVISGGVNNGILNVQGYDLLDETYLQACNLTMGIAVYTPNNLVSSTSSVNPSSDIPTISEIDGVEIDGVKWTLTNYFELDDRVNLVEDLTDILVSEVNSSLVTTSNVSELIDEDTFNVMCPEPATVVANGTSSITDVGTPSGTMKLEGTTYNNTEWVPVVYWTCDNIRSYTQLIIEDNLGNTITTINESGYSNSQEGTVSYVYDFTTTSSTSITWTFKCINSETTYTLCTLEITKPDVTTTTTTSYAFKSIISEYTSLDQTGWDINQMSSSNNFSLELSDGDLVVSEAATSSSSDNLMNVSAIANATTFTLQSGIPYTFSVNLTPSSDISVNALLIEPNGDYVIVANTSTSNSDGTTTLTADFTAPSDCTMRCYIGFNGNGTQSSIKISEVIVYSTVTTTSGVSSSEAITPGFYSYTLTRVPFVNYEYIHNPYLFNNFTTILLEAAKNVKNAMDYITNNFTLDVKFFNTYGISKFFYVDNNPDYLITGINITIHLAICLSSVYSSNTTVQTSISTYIRNYVENLNSDENFYVSNLINELQSNFEEISYIKFVNLNNYPVYFNYETIESTDEQLYSYSTSTVEENNFTPEYININKNFTNNITGVPDYTYKSTNPTPSDVDGGIVIDWIQ